MQLELIPVQPRTRAAARRLALELANRRAAQLGRQPAAVTMMTKHLISAALLALASMSALADVCPPWVPSSAPYRGDVAAAVRRLSDIPADERETLAIMAGAKFSGVRVYSGPNGVEGANLGNRRNMNGAGGHVCAGATNYSQFPAGRREAGWAYILGRRAVIVYDSCGNVEQADNLDVPAPALSSRDAHAARLAAPGVGPGLRTPGTRAEQSGPTAGAQVSVVPEPGSLPLLLACGVAAWLLGRRS